MSMTEQEIQQATASIIVMRQNKSESKKISEDRRYGDNKYHRRIEIDAKRAEIEDGRAIDQDFS